MNMFNALWCTLSSALLLLLECIFKSQLESLSRFCWSLRVSRSYQSSFGSDLRKEVPLRPYYFSPPFALQLDFNHKCVYLKGKNKKDRLIGKLTQGGKNSKKVLYYSKKESKVTFELQLLSQCLKGSCGRSSFPWPLSWSYVFNDYPPPLGQNFGFIPGQAKSGLSGDRWQKFRVYPPPSQKPGPDSYPPCQNLGWTRMVMMSR